MTFYFKPPRGNIPLHKLQECLEERVRYLNFVKKSTDISECCEQFKFEYLTDGSALDRTGHFMLRLISPKLNGLKEFLIDSESNLFEKRLACLRHTQIDKELRTALRHVKEILSACNPLTQYKAFLLNFSKICEEIIHSAGARHTFRSDHTCSCKKYFLQVPFTFCLPLVATRDVELTAGEAIVPCGRWVQLLCCLFVEHLKFGMQHLLASTSYVWDDDRLKYLTRAIKAQFNSHHSSAMTNSCIALAKDVDKICSLFPPCMRNFHKTLRQRHRLSHQSRFYYSLFLKDIGMPLMESIEFWSQEYTQAKNAECISCSHTWQRDSKKYIYSLRHMYGLEGSRRTYCSVNCQQLQKMSSSASTDGGCPFLNFDHKNLLSCLHTGVTFDQPTEESLNAYKTEESAVKTCKRYLKNLQRLKNERTDSMNEDEDIFKSTESVDTFSPLQFFFKNLGTSKPL